PAHSPGARVEPEAPSATVVAEPPSSAPPLAQALANKATTTRVTAPTLGTERRLRIPTPLRVAGGPGQTGANRGAPSPRFAPELLLQLEGAEVDATADDAGVARQVGLGRVLDAVHERVPVHVLVPAVHRVRARHQSVRREREQVVDVRRCGQAPDRLALEAAPAEPEVPVRLAAPVAEHAAPVVVRGRRLRPAEVLEAGAEVAEAAVGGSGADHRVLGDDVGAVELDRFR